MTRRSPSIEDIPILGEPWRVLQELRAMNHLNLSRPHVSCQVIHSEALPAVAYNIIAVLAEAVETASAELDELFTAEE